MARELPNRRMIRVRGYNYTQEGAYYVTICTDDRRHGFGRIADAVMHRSSVRPVKGSVRPVKRSARKMPRPNMDEPRM